MLFRSVRWAVAHGQEVSGSHDGYSYLAWLRELRTLPFAHLIEQDFLLMGAREDHIVPIDQFYSQASDLKNVRSLTAQLFTRTDHAQAHCHVGNMPLVTGYVINWINFWLKAESLRAAQQPAT